MYSWKFSLWHKCFQNPGLRFNFKWINLQALNKFRQVAVSNFLAIISNSSLLKSARFLWWKFRESILTFLLETEEIFLVKMARFFDLKLMATEDWPRLAMMLPFFLSLSCLNYWHSWLHCATPVRNSVWPDPGNITSNLRFSDFSREIFFWRAFFFWYS